MRCSSFVLEPRGLSVVAATPPSLIFREECFRVTCQAVSWSDKRAVGQAMAVCWLDQSAPARLTQID